MVRLTNQNTVCVTTQNAWDFPEMRLDLSIINKSSVSIFYGDKTFNAILVLINALPSLKLRALSWDFAVQEPGRAMYLKVLGFILLELFCY